VLYKADLSWNKQPRCLERGNHYISRSEGSCKRIQAINSCHIVHNRRDQHVRAVNPPEERLFLYIAWKGCTTVLHTAKAELVGLSLPKTLIQTKLSIPIEQTGTKRPLNLNTPAWEAQLPEAKLWDGLALLQLSTAAERSHHRVKKRQPTPWTKPILTQTAKSKARQVWMKSLVPPLTIQTRVFVLSKLFITQKHGTS